MVNCSRAGISLRARKVIHWFFKFKKNVKLGSSEWLNSPPNPSGTAASLPVLPQAYTYASSTVSMGAISPVRLNHEKNGGNPAKNTIHNVV